MHPASPAYSRSQRAIFSGVAVRAGIRMSARQDGPRGLPDYSRRDLAAFGFDNSQTNRLRVIEIFCWTRTAFFDTLATQSGEISRKIRLMKTCSLIVVGAVFMILSHLAGATQADDTTITITGHTPGVTPFISNVSLHSQQYDCSEEHPVHDRSKARLRHPTAFRHLRQLLPREPRL